MVVGEVTLDAEGNVTGYIPFPVKVYDMYMAHGAKARFTAGEIQAVVPVPRQQLTSTGITTYPSPGEPWGTLFVRVHLRNGQTYDLEARYKEELFEAFEASS